MSREHVRIVGQLRRRGVVQRGDDVTVVNVQRPRERREISVFRKSMRLLGMLAIVVAIYAGWIFFWGTWDGSKWDPDFVGKYITYRYFYGGCGMVMVVAGAAMSLWAAVKDGFFSAIGVLVLVLPASILLSWLVCLMIPAIANRL